MVKSGLRKLGLVGAFVAAGATNLFGGEKQDDNFEALKILEDVNATQDLNLEGYQNITGIDYIRNWPNSIRGQNEDLTAYRKQFDDGSVSWIIQRDKDNYVIGSLMYVDVDGDGKFGENEKLVREKGIVTNYVQGHPESSQAPSTKVERNSEELITRAYEAIYQAGLKGGREEAEKERQKWIGRYSSLTDLFVDNAAESTSDRGVGLSIGGGISSNQTRGLAGVVEGALTVPIGDHFLLDLNVHYGVGSKKTLDEETTDASPSGIYGHGTLTQEGYNFGGAGIIPMFGGKVADNWNLHAGVGAGVVYQNTLDKATAEIMRDGNVLSGNSSYENKSLITPEIQAKIQATHDKSGLTAALTAGYVPETETWRGGAQIGYSFKAKK